MSNEELVAEIQAGSVELGQKDAQQGKSAYPVDVFPALMVKVFCLDSTKITKRCRLWQICGNPTIWTDVSVLLGKHHSK
mgnify:CR=1 FL=1